MPSGARAALAWGLGLSVLLHLLLASQLTLMRVSRPSSSRASTIEIAIDEARSSTLTRTATPVKDTAAPVVQARLGPPRARAPHSAAFPSDPPSLDPPMSLSSAPLAAIPPAVLRLSPPSAIDLRPRAVAQGSVPLFADATPQRLCGLAQDVAERCDAPQRRGPQERLQQSLEDVATARSFRAPEAPPELHRQPDGSYSYEGPVFSATIRPDGTVSLVDRAAIQLGRFDVNDMIENERGARGLSAEGMALVPVGPASCTIDPSSCGATGAAVPPVLAPALAPEVAALPAAAGLAPAPATIVDAPMLPAWLPSIAARFAPRAVAAQSATAAIAITPSTRFTAHR